MSKAADARLKRVLESFSGLSPKAWEQAVADLETTLRYGLPEDVHARCREDVWEFAHVFLPHMLRDPKTDIEYTPAHFHRELYDLSRDAVLKRGDFARTRGLVAAAPRGFGKSTIISLIVVIWAIVYEHKRFIVIFADTDDQAEMIGMNIRKEFEENEILHFYFGQMEGHRYGLKWTLRDFTLVKPDEKTGQKRYVGRVKVRGTGSSTRGIRERQYRPDLVVGDDLENDEDVENDEVREKLYNNWWSGAVLKMLDPNYGSVIVVGTILHMDSLLSRLIKLGETLGAYAVRLWTCFDAYGKSVWEERFPTERLEAMREENPLAFAREMLNDPRAAETRVFRPESVRFYTGQDVTHDGNGTWRFRGEPLAVYTAVDPAIDEKDDACQFAIVTCGLTPDRKTIIVLSVRMERIDFPAQLDACLNELRLFRPRQFGFETTIYQRALPQMTRRLLREHEQFPVKELKHGNSSARKRRRITGISPLVRAGRCWFRAASDEQAGTYDELGRVRVHHSQYALYEQLMQYPMAKLNDGVDALAGCIETMGDNLLFASGTWSEQQEQTPLYQQILDAA